MNIRKALSTLFIFALLVSFSIAQSGAAESGNETLETSEKANSDVVYKELRTLSADTSSFSGEYASVNNFVLKKDAALFTFRNGEIYFLKEAQGRRTGAVFIGAGELSIVPPIETEKRMLQFFTGSKELKENFTQLVMFFTDKTFENVKKSSNVKISTNGPQANRARKLFQDKESYLRNKARENITTRTLMSIYAPHQSGFFLCFVAGKKYNKLKFIIDPLGVYPFSPEQVVLINYDKNSGGIWLSFHLTEEYKKGTGNSDQDRRIFDISHHNINMTIKGVRLIGKDEITLKPMLKGRRVLPFSLFSPLRVRRVLDENGDEISFIQESEARDGDLAVILPKAYEVGESFKLTFIYDGLKALINEGRGNFFLVPRSTWYPNNLVAGFEDRATFELKFYYPKIYMLIGSGELVDSSEDEDMKYAHWSTKGVEMAVAGFNYGDFRKQELVDKSTGYELSVYTNKELSNNLKSRVSTIENLEATGNFSSNLNIGSINTASLAKTVLDEAVSSTRLYDYYFGKLPHKRVAMTQQPAGFFGQAWATLVWMPIYAFVDKTHRRQLLRNSNFWREVGPHEVAHQWWGHAVGWKSYRDQWMSEGFSEFSTSLFVQYVYKDQNRFIKYWEHQRKRIVNAGPDTNGIKPYTIGPVTQGRRLISTKAPGAYRRMVYPKGAYILHMLRMLMIDTKARGMKKDARFRAMMRDFVKTHYNKDVSTEDFKRIVEKHITPQMDLYKNGKMDWFFDQWVYGTEVPEYEFQYRLGKSKGQTILNAKLIQSGVSDRFVMPIPIYVDYGKGWVELGKATLVGNKTYELKNIPLPVKPKKVAILALKDILATKIKNRKY